MENQGTEYVRMCVCGQFSGVSPFLHVAVTVDGGHSVFFFFLFFFSALGTQEHIISFAVPFKIKLRRDIQ